MLRKIISIRKELCNGCGKCAERCDKGALEIDHGTARLIEEEYCDGKGICVDACPAGAIRSLTQDSHPFDDQAVEDHLEEWEISEEETCTGSACQRTRHIYARHPSTSMGQWPIQLGKAPLTSPAYEHADLLVAASCAGFIYPDLSERFIRGRCVLVSCPDLEKENYLSRLQEIVQLNPIHSLTVVRLESPCCMKIGRYALRAVMASGRKIPLRIVILSRNGHIVDVAKSEQ